MNPTLKWIGVSLLVLFASAYALLSFMAGGPRDALYLVRYALPYMHRGSLKVGDQAPDARLVALDGSSRFHLREKTAGRPLVLIFGSFT